MVTKTQDEIEKEEAQLKKEKATFHFWKDKTKIKATGKFPAMPKGAIYEEHKLAAEALVKKGYAVYATLKDEDDE